MKSLLTTALMSSALLISTNVVAKPLSDGQALSQCKALASSQFEDVSKIRLAQMKKTRGVYKVKLRVKSPTDNGLFLCTIERNLDAQIVRLDTKSGALASKG